MTKKNLHDTFKVALIFASTMIGAGFASGQELLQFFITYGSLGFCGILFAGLLFSYLGFRLLTLSYRLQAQTYSALLTRLFGPILGKLFDWLVWIFLFTVLTLMIASGGTISEENFSLPFSYGTLLLALLICYFALQSLSQITRLSYYAAPLLICAILLTTISSISYHSMPKDLFRIAAYHTMQPSPHWLLSCVLYISYNITLGMTILVPLGATIRHNSIRLYGSFCGGICIAILAFFITISILLHTPTILDEQLPMLTIACSQHAFHAFFYLLIFIIAMLTTATSCLYSCAKKLHDTWLISFPSAILLLILSSLYCSQFEFSTIIGTVFPLFGYSTIIILIQLLRCK